MFNINTERDKTGNRLIRRKRVGINEKSEKVLQNSSV